MARKTDRTEIAQNQKAVRRTDFTTPPNSGGVVVRRTARAIANPYNYEAFVGVENVSADEDNDWSSSAREVKVYQILCLTVSGFVLVAVYSFYGREKPRLSYSAPNGCI